MNFLALCKTVQRLQRSASGLVGTTPTTTLSQSGDLLEIVENVDQAYQDIQNKHSNWRFMVSTQTFNTVASTREYTPETEISTFDTLIPYMAQEMDSPYILSYLTATGVSDESMVYYVPYAEFAAGVLDRGTRSEARPAKFTIKPNGDWEFDPTPSAVYTLKFDMRRTTHDLSTIVSGDSADANEPIIPSRHHMAIVWGALRYHCITRDGTSEFLAKVDREYLREMRRLENAQLPDALLHETFLYP